MPSIVFCVYIVHMLKTKWQNGGLLSLQSHKYDKMTTSHKDLRRQR